MLHTVGRSVAVTATPTKLFSFQVGQLHSIVIRPDAACNIIPAGQAFGTGLPLSADEPLALSHTDFSINQTTYTDVVELWAVCDAGQTANVNVYGFMKTG